MLKFIKSGFTGPDGSLDDGRVAAFMLVLTFIGNSIYALHLKQAWDPQTYGIGAGALVAGVGALFKLRGDN